MSRVEQIGNCTLYLGDCMEVTPLLSRVDAILTDPPYGIGFTFGKKKNFLPLKYNRNYA